MSQLVMHYIREVAVNPVTERIGLVPAKPAKKLGMWEQYGSPVRCFFQDESKTRFGKMPKMVEGGFIAAPDHVVFPAVSREATMRTVVRTNRNLVESDEPQSYAITRRDGWWLECAWVGTEKGNRLRILRFSHEKEIVVPKTVHLLPSLVEVKEIMQMLGKA